MQFDFLKISLIGLIASIIGVIFMVIYHFVKKKEKNDDVVDSYDEVLKEDEDYHGDVVDLNELYKDASKEKDDNINDLYAEVSKGEDEEYHEYDEENNNFSDDDI